MKILIVGTPRSGSTYLFNVLSQYYLEEMVLDSLRYHEYLMDEPFSQYSNNYAAQKTIFDKLSKMESWVVKMHSSQIDSVNHKWITKLYKQADIIVKLTRKDFPAQVRSLCIAQALNDWGHHDVKNIHVSKQIFVDSYMQCLYDSLSLKSVPHDVVIDYDNLTSPQDIIYHITGLHVGEFKFARLLPTKNTSNIRNIDEIRQWMKEIKHTMDGLKHA